MNRSLFPIRYQEATPLLCAGITTYSPIMKFDLR
jgi:uncharacterized zinc-type alcohol dehydrogenase-like protein